MSEKRIIVDQPDLIGSWVAAKTQGEWVRGMGTAIGLIDENLQLLAGVAYTSWNGASLYMHVAAVPGRQWLNRKFLHICFDYPFNQLGAKKLIGLVGSQNADALRFDQNLGFVLEATLKGAHPDGDLLVLTMTREQCRWLNHPNLKVNYGKTQSSPAA